MNTYLPGTMRERLKDLREDKGLKQYQVADYLGINKTTYSRIENGTTETVTHELLMKLAELYEVNVEFLMGSSDTRDQMDFELSQLGLSVEAAKNLYTKKADPRVINELLLNDKFLKCTKLLASYFSGTLEEYTRTANAQRDFFYQMILSGTAEGLFDNDQEMKDAKRGLQLTKESPTQYDLETIRNLLMGAIREIKEKMVAEQTAYLENMGKSVSAANILTADFAKEIIAELKEISKDHEMTYEEKVALATSKAKTIIALDENISDKVAESIAAPLVQIVATLGDYGESKLDETKK